MAGVIACGGAAKVESGAGGSASRAEGGTSNVGANAGNPGSAQGGTPTSSDGHAGRSSLGGNVGCAGDFGDSGAAGEPGVGACEVDGGVHLVGEAFACACNTCWCEADATISSASDGCKICVYMDEIHAPGEKFRDRDGCNDCECTSTGEVSCTEKSCGCQPEKEWYRHYVSTNAKTCELGDYECPTHTTPFSGSCGCGCEEPVDCPQWVDCEPGNPACQPTMKRCPYSPGAF